MDAPTQNTALLLFLRSESEEALAKPLARGGRRVNKAVFQKLNHHAQRQARKSGLPLLTVKGRQQSGHTFGERLANAFEYAFAQGYGRIIAIGNDCLALDADRLREAAIVRPSCPPFAAIASIGLRPASAVRPVGRRAFCRILSFSA